MQIGRVVKSSSGRDKHRFYAVVGNDSGYVLIADGKIRKIESPKRKNEKHLRPTNTFLDITQHVSNKKLRELLKTFNTEYMEGGN